MRTFKCGCTWALRNGSLEYRACTPHKMVLEGIGQMGFLYPPDVPVNVGGLRCCYCRASTIPAARVVYREVECVNAETMHTLRVWRPFCPNCTPQKVVIP